MTERIIKKLLEWECRNDLISKDDMNLYRYGYILLFEVMINSVLAIIIGCLFGNLHTAIIFLALYIPLRSFCGGWHAGRIWKCTILSNVILIVMLTFAKVNLIGMYKWQFFALFLVCWLFVFLKAPVGTAAKPIGVEDRLRYKKIIHLIQGVHMVLLVIVAAAEKEEMTYTIIFVYMLQTVMLAAELIKSNKNNTGAADVPYSDLR